MGLVTRNRPTWQQRDGSLTVGVVGLGYWGPNLIRNLHELRA